MLVQTKRNAPEVRCVVCGRRTCEIVTLSKVTEVGTPTAKNPMPDFLSEEVATYTNCRNCKLNYWKKRQAKYLPPLPEL